MALHRGRLASVALLAAACLPAWGAVPAPASPSPEPGKALVYLVRTGRLSGAAGAIYVFADKSFVGLLHNGTYAYAQLEPGHRLFWTTWTKATRELDLVPGETYYLDVWREIAVVDAGQGRALVQKVKDLSEPDEGDRAKAANYVDKKYGHAVEKEGKREKAEVAEVASPAAAPEGHDGMVRIPAYTQALLEFMETVTSEFSPTGTAVDFRLAQDVVVDGETIAHAGRVVRGVVRDSSQAGVAGKAGTMEVVVPSLKTEEGAVVPLVAQLVGSGGDKENGAATAGILAGPFAAIAVHGKEAFYLAGEHLKVWTREDAWIRRTASAAAEPASDSPQPAAASAQSLPAHVIGPVYFKPSKGYRPDDVTVIVETADPVGPVLAVAVGDFTLPEPVIVKHQAHREDGVYCTFDGWSVVRYLRAGQDTTPQPLHLSGRFTDGRPFAATAAVSYTVEK